jgi:uncharacterized DUF497 family protein
VDVEWDPRKSAANLRKHGIAFADAATVLDDVLGLTIEDKRFAEQRFVTVGTDAFGRILVVVYVYPENANAVRLLSARRATASERHQYHGKT